jgi:hypothetical protein
VTIVTDIFQLLFRYYLPKVYGSTKKLFDLIEKNKAEVEKVIRPVKGFVSYSLIRTARGGLSIIICEDKAGTDESTRAARDWIAKNARDTGVARPKISEGTVILEF